MNSFSNIFVIKFDGGPPVKRSLPQCRFYSLNETAFSSAFVGISRVYQWCEQHLGWQLTVSNTGRMISLFLCYSQCSSYRHYIFLSLSYIPNIFSITFHLNNKSESKLSPDLRHFPVPMLCFHRGWFQATNMMLVNKELGVAHGVSCFHHTDATDRNKLKNWEIKKI